MSSSSSSCVEVRKRGAMSMVTLIGMKDHLTSIGCANLSSDSGNGESIIYRCYLTTSDDWFDVLSVKFEQEPT